MRFKEKPLPQLPGRVYKRHSKYWEAFGFSCLLLILLLKAHTDGGNFSLETTLCLSAAAIFLPFAIAWKWKALVSETYISPSLVKIVYTDGRTHSFPLSEGMWFLQQVSTNSLGKAYTYKLHILRTSAISKEPIDGQKAFIRTGAPVITAFHVQRIRDFIQSVQMMAGYELPMGVENKQMSADYDAGTFIKLKK